MGSSSKTTGVTYHTSIVLIYNKIIQPLSNAYRSYHRPLNMGYLRQVALLALLASAYCKPLIGTKEMDRNEDENTWSMENMENPNEIVESEHLFEGDMMLTEEQFALMKGTDRVLDLSINVI